MKQVVSRAPNTWRDKQMKRRDEEIARLRRALDKAVDDLAILFRYLERQPYGEGKEIWCFAGTAEAENHDGTNECDRALDRLHAFTEEARRAREGE